MLTELCLCYYNGAQWYELFLQVGQLDQALILLGLDAYLTSTSVSSVSLELCIFEINVRCNFKFIFTTRNIGEVTTSFIVLN